MDDKLEKLIDDAETSSVNLFKLDEELVNEFLDLYDKRLLFKLNFKNLKGLTRYLHGFVYHVECIGLNYHIESDLITLTNALKDAIETRVQGYRQFCTSEEHSFLIALDIYHDGLRKMKRYEEGIRNFLRLAEVKYEKFFEGDHADMDADIYTFDMYLASFHCVKWTYVASNGIIAERHLQLTNLGFP